MKNAIVVAATLLIVSVALPVRGMEFVGGTGTCGSPSACLMPWHGGTNVTAPSGGIPVSVPAPLENARFRIDSRHRHAKFLAEHDEGKGLLRVSVPIRRGTRDRCEATVYHDEDGRIIGLAARCGGAVAALSGVSQMPWHGGTNVTAPSGGTNGAARAQFWREECAADFVGPRDPLCNTLRLMGYGTTGTGQGGGMAHMAPIVALPAPVGQCLDGHALRPLREGDAGYGVLRPRRPPADTCCVVPTPEYPSGCHPCTDWEREVFTSPPATP